MAELFNRDFSVQIGPRLIRARPEEDDVAKPTLRVFFKIEKSLAKAPNQAEVTIYNLSDDSRSAIQEKGAFCIVEAGYVGNVSQLFTGDLTFASTKKVGVDWISTFQSGDGSKQYRSSRINESFPKGTSLAQIMKRASTVLGVDLGNAVEKFNEGNFRKGFEAVSRGMVLQGRTSDEIEKLLKSAGFKWSIQDGALQVLRDDETTEDEAIVLSSGAGLVESPEVGEKGIVTATSLLQGRIRPGRSVNIESRELSGFFKVLSVTHTGDTWDAKNWITQLEAKPL